MARLDEDATFGRHYQGVLKLDLSFGDPVYPAPRMISIPPRFPGQMGGELLAYPVRNLETRNWG